MMFIKLFRWDMVQRVVNHLSKTREQSGNPMKRLALSGSVDATYIVILSALFYSRSHHWWSFAKQSYLCC